MRAPPNPCEMPTMDRTDGTKTGKRAKRLTGALRDAGVRITRQRAALLDVLAAEGGRRTAARRAIVAAFVATAGAVTADELTARVQADAPDVNQSTVYRVLEALEAAGAADRAETGREAAAWHLVAGDHHHLRCSVCGRVEEVGTDAVAALAAAVEAETGFVLSDHLVLTGRCARCGRR